MKKYLENTLVGIAFYTLFIPVVMFTFLYCIIEILLRRGKIH